MVTCYPSYDMTPPLPSPAQCGHGAGTTATKDYSRPLHVDCSVEYELPDAAKPPAGQRSEPLLMIHPCYYRRAEAQRRTRFVNNLPKSMSSPVTSSSSSSASASSSGRRSSKVARLAVEPSWPAPKPVSVYPAPSAASGSVAAVGGGHPAQCYKVGATADYSTSAWPGRTPAAPSSAKLDAGAVLSDIIASTCSELNNNNNSSSNNNNYMKASQTQTAQQPSSHSQSSGSSGGGGSQLYERQLGGSCAAGGVSSYPQLAGYHPHAHAVDCKTCQYQPSHPHSHHHTSSSSGNSTTTTTSTTSSSSQHPASQATQVNRLYGGGLVKAVEANPELAANPVPAKVSPVLGVTVLGAMPLGAMRGALPPWAMPDFSEEVMTRLGDILGLGPSRVVDWMEWARLQRQLGQCQS